jgi:hypothetical protein
MPDQIRVKRDLFGRVSEIDAIVRDILSRREHDDKKSSTDVPLLAAADPPVAKKGKKALKEAPAPGPAFKPEIGFLKEDAPFDIGIGLKKSTPEILAAIKITLEEEFEEKKIVVE